MILLGIYSLVSPSGMLTGITVVYGVFAVLTGIADISFYVKMERRTGFGPSVALVTGILSLLADILLLCNIGAGRWAMTLLFPLWFIAHCISRLSHLSLIRMIAGNVSYYFTLVINILGLFLGFMMLLNPYLALISAGWLIGMYLICQGVDSLLLSFAMLQPFPLMKEKEVGPFG